MNVKILTKIFKEYIIYLNINYDCEMDDIKNKVENYLVKNEGLIESISKRCKRNPLLPKKSTNGYQIFSKENRKKGIDGKNFFTIIGEKWRLLTDKEKDEYNILAEKDKQRYFIEKDKKGLNKVRKNKISGYNLFCKENNNIVKKDNPTFNSKQVLSETSKRWKHLSYEEKDKYLKKAELLNLNDI
jgi:hypothetical protein